MGGFDTSDTLGDFLTAAHRDLKASCWCHSWRDGRTDGQHVPNPRKTPTESNWLCNSHDNISTACTELSPGLGGAVVLQSGLRVKSRSFGRLIPARRALERRLQAPRRGRSSLELLQGLTQLLLCSGPNRGLFPSKVGLKTQQNQTQPSKVNTCYFIFFFSPLRLRTFRH